MTGQAIHLTRHALTRCQQRGIPVHFIEILYRYGVRRYHRGILKVMLDKRRKSRLLSDPECREMLRHKEHLLDVYLVVADGQVLTAAYRRQRFKS